MFHFASPKVLSRPETVFSDPVDTPRSSRLSSRRRAPKLLGGNHRFRQPYLLLTLLYLFTFSLLAGVLRHRHGFPLDDSYIHQTVARNLANYGTLGFTPGHRSSGATSLLWTLLQAANYKWLGSIDPVWYNLALSYLFFAPIGPLLFLLARRDRLPLQTSYVLAIAPAFTGNFLWLGMIGMEHLLFVTLSLLVIALWFQPGPRPRWNAIAAGCAAGLLTLTRPEAALLGPLLAICGWRVRSVRRSRGEIAILLAIWASSLSVMVGTNLWTSGTFMPVTLKGRSWLYFHGTGGPHSLRSIARFCGGWIQRVPRQFSVSYTHQLVSLRDIRNVAAIFGLSLVIIAIFGVFSLLREKPLSIGVLLLWAFVHFNVYLLTFPAGGHGGRYQPLCLLLFFPLLLLGAQFLALKLLPLRKDPVFLGVCAVMFLASLASLRTWRRVTFVGISHIDDTHGKIALWMKQNVPASAKFAAFDIGRVSYDRGGDVIDLGGLVDPTYYRYLQNRQIPEYLRERHVQYVLLPGSGSEELGIDYGTLRGHKLVEYCSPTDDWLLGFRYTIHATRCQDLYQLDGN